MPDEHFDLSPSELKQYFRNFFTLISNCFRFLFSIAAKNYLPLLLLGIFSFGSIYFFLKHKAKEYDYRMSCVYNDNQARTFGEMIGQLDLLLQNKELQLASKELGLPVDKIEKISSIKAKTITLGVLEHDYSNNKNPFFIDVTLKDPSIVAEVEAQVLSYLNHNDLSVRSQNKQKAKWKSRDEFYSNQLAKLDSLKEVIRLSYLQNNNQIDLAQKNNSVVDIYRLSDSMAFNQEDIKYYLDHYESVQKIYGFKLISIHSQSSIIKKSILLSICAIILLWLLLAMRSFIKKGQTSLS